MKGPLSDLKILEAVAVDCPTAIRLAVALAGRIVADLGAEVIKVEPASGDPVRTMGPMVEGHSTLFAFLNAGKCSVVLPDAEGVFSDLARPCDAMLCDAMTLARCSAPRVRVAISLLSEEGDLETQASEFTVSALGGVLNLVGEAEREPLRLGGHQAAYAGGLSAFAGLLGALCGEGQEVVNVSLLETAVWLNWKNVASAAVGGEAPSRAGRASAWPIVRCADGYVAVVYQNRDWPRLVELLGHDPRLSDPSFKSAEVRAVNAAMIANVVEEHFLEFTRLQIHALAVEWRLPLGAVWQPGELQHDQHYLARDFLRQVQLADGVQVRQPRLPVLWNGQAFRAGPIPCVPLR